MTDFCSPLRYPGGKAKLAPLLGEILTLNRLRDITFVEPYAGGGGAALTLLFEERVSDVILNDLDYAVYSFWWAILHRPDDFLEMLETVPLTVDEWRRQKTIFLKPRNRVRRLDLGFSAFYLNRCNRSGIIVNGGPIGGYKQRGRWRIDARFNRSNLRRRLERVIAYKERIRLSNMDAEAFLRDMQGGHGHKIFAYIDPPYYEKGPLLYLNSYGPEDHARVARCLLSEVSFNWVLSYDNVEAIRSLYSELPQEMFDLSYTAYGRRVGREILVFPPQISVPSPVTEWVA